MRDTSGRSAEGLDRTAMAVLDELSVRLQPPWAQTGTIEIHVAIEGPNAPLARADVLAYDGQKRLARATASASGEAKLPGLPANQKLLVIVRSPGYGSCAGGREIGQVMHPDYRKSKQHWWQRILRSRRVVN